MKREHLGWIVACLLIVVVAAGAMQQRADGPVGRYQMVSGRHVRNIVTADGLAEKEVPTMLLLDTTTGRVWEFGSVIAAGDLMRVWSPMKDWWDAP
jgi:hypothetical protein